MWSATSNVLFRAGSFRIDQLNSHGTRIRWPELETGANSVMPWVRPSTIACRIDTEDSFGPERPRHRTRGPSATEPADVALRLRPPAVRGRDRHREVGVGGGVREPLGRVRRD